MQHHKTCKKNTQKKLVQPGKLGLKTKTSGCAGILYMFQTENYLTQV